MKHIEKLSLEKLATDVQGVFLNIDWKFKTIQDLRAIDFSPKFLTNGIVFMWSDKELLSDIIEVMAEKRFKYIENICIAMIDASSVCPQASNTIQQSALHDKTACMEQLRDVTKEPEECFMHELNDRYIKCCKKIVLMFHRVALC